MIPRNIFEHFLFLHIIFSVSFTKTIYTQSLVVEGSTSRIICLERERQALLNFKKELIDEYGILSSWGEEGNKRECCKWRGVLCNNTTNHVTRLDLHADDPIKDGHSPLRGSISPSLLELEDLNYLDLSCNDFSHTQYFPQFIGSLYKLQYLNLSYANISGPISHHLQNLTNLKYLDLSNINAYREIHGDNLDWISPNLHSLEYLDLSFSNLSKASYWLQAISTLPSIKELHLSDCDLPPTIAKPSSSLRTFSLNASSSLSILDLSYNDRLFSSNSDLIFSWFLNFNNSLTHLDLSSTYLKSSNIPDAFQNMASLSQLDVSNNMLEYVPKYIGNMSSLMQLSLSNNSLTGQLSDIMMILSGTLENKLQILDLGWNMISGMLPNVSRFSLLTTLILPKNQLSGTISEGFLQLPNLDFLDLSHNNFTGPVPNLSFSKRSLRVLYLHENRFNGTLTESIGSLSRLEVLFLRSDLLQGTVTEAHVANLSHLKLLHLSGNSMLTVKWNPHFVPPFQLHYMALGSCKLGPRFPKWLGTQKELVFLDVSGAQISDTLSNLFDNLPPTLAHLDASNNQIHGFLPHNTSFSIFNSRTVPFLEFLSIEQEFALDLSRNNISGSAQSLCNWTKLNSVDLSFNFLSGHLPDCFTSFDDLQYLNLENNQFHGTIPSSIGSLYSLTSLHLQLNNFSGEIPISIRNCKNLVVIELQENRLTGEIPTWIGDHLSNIVALVLRSNLFHGNMPSNLCGLQHMQILDISSNKISGVIPYCLYNLTAMINAEDEENRVLYDIRRIRFPSFSSSHKRYISLSIYESANIRWKKVEVNIYSLGLLTLIDLSSNNLTGEIPSGITELVSLIGLNLSNNNFSGPIPQNIGQLNLLNVLDLSRNHYSGAIPTSLSELSHLGTLNLSYNNLSGRIPLNGHSLTFNESAPYLGNSGLCGPPLNRSCPGDYESTINTPDHDDGHGEVEDEFISEGFYISMLFGFVVGFWVIVGTMLLSKSFRYSFLKGRNRH